MSYLGLFRYLGTEIEYIPTTPISVDKFVLFKAQDVTKLNDQPHILAIAEDEFLGWGPFSEQQPIVCQIAGDHSAILDEPFVEELAAVLSQYS